MKTSRSVFLFLFLLAQSYWCLAQGFWKALPNAPVTQRVARHEDVFFVDPSVGWVVNLIGQIFKTTNGGESWVKQFDDGQARFRSVGFANSLRGWAGTLDSALLYQTTDGGSAWSKVRNLPAPKPKGICGISVVNDSVVYGSGFNNGPAHVIKTMDAGKTWSSIVMEKFASILIDCYFFSPDSGFVVGGIGGNRADDATKGVVLFTPDGGKTWQTRFTTSGTREWCWKIYFRSRKIGYVSIESLKNPAHFLETTDGGITWRDKPCIGANLRMQSIAFASDTLGWIGGYKLTYETSDGGSTWRLVNWGEYINRFRMFGDSLGYAVGRTVYKYSSQE